MPYELQQAPERPPTWEAAITATWVIGGIAQISWLVPLTSGWHVPFAVLGLAGMAFGAWALVAIKSNGGPTSMRIAASGGMLLCAVTAIRALIWWEKYS